MKTAANDTGLRCVECDYNLTGVKADRCPECGWVIDRSLIEFARDSEPSQVQRVMLAYLCGFTAVAAGTIIVLNDWTPTFFSVFPVKRTHIEPIVWRLTAAAVSANLLLYFFRTIPYAPTWPIHAPSLARVGRLVAMTHILSAGVLIARQTNITPGGWPGYFVLFGLSSIAGWVLLFATSIAFAGRREVVRRMKVQRRRQPDVEPEGAPFVVDVAGRHTHEQVEVVCDDTPRTTDATIEALIEQTWQERTKSARELGQTLYNGKVGRLVGFERNGDVLRLRLGETTYREFLGTNLYNAHLRATFGDACFANPLGTSASIITADGYLLYGRRSEKVAYHAGYLHTFGGMLEPQDKLDDGRYDVFSAVRREVCEELKVTGQEIRDVICTGIVRGIAIGQPELLFDAYLHITRGEVLSRFNAATDEEHSAIEGCHDEPDAVAPFIRRTAPVVPVAQGAILLHGLATFGRDWYENNCYVLFGDLPAGTTKRS